MKRLHIIGRKNSGKTTLIVELVEHLTSRGYRVGTIKHTHHRHELDVPGKDSFKHRQAGAAPVAILTPGMTAVFRPVEEDPREERYGLISPLFVDCDLVLVEGDSQSPGDRLEVWREAVGDQPYAADDRTIAAVISDDRVNVDRPVWKRSPLEALANQVLEFMIIPAPDRPVET